MIYVDDMQPCQRDLPRAGRFKFTNYCRLFTQSGGNIQELHDFAQGIGLKRSYFKAIATHPHYALTLNKRVAARALGAMAVPREMFDVICRRSQGC